MSSPFRKFATVFEQFQEKYLKHPLIEEIRNHLSRGKFPTEIWLESKTKRMTMFLSPSWEPVDSDEENVAS